MINSLTEGLSNNNEISDFDLLQEGININKEQNKKVDELVLFNVKDFQNDLRQKSNNKNKNYHFFSENITSYDISSGCSRAIIFRIKNYPVKNYSDKWLPVQFRSVLGNACHEFIQNNCNKLTEKEVSLKVPSLNISARLDGIINDNVLLEIKSCGYTDFSKILKSELPRSKDFYQILFYKYLLENHLDEIKLQEVKYNGSLPKLNNYNIRYIQIIYICHELISGDSNSLSEAVEFAKKLRKLNESKKNQFWWLHVINLDLSKVSINEYIQIIKNKINDIRYHLLNNKIPDLNSDFIDKTSCFFCLYKDICSTI